MSGPEKMRTGGTVRFNKATIIGVGLIGGSIARVLKAKRLAGTVWGAGRSRATLASAKRLGVIDRACGDIAASVKGADLVVLATPVGTFRSLVARIAPNLKPGAIVTDVGSVKGELVRSIDRLLPEGVAFVPGHPIAGKERSGVEESSAGLFRGKRCILTPTTTTDPAAYQAVHALWTAAGATVLLMDPDEHDHVFAAVSHLPHVAAYAMVAAVADLKTGSEGYLAYTGGGFRDFTRIAASSPEMWRDICLQNRVNIIEMIERYQFWLNKLKRAVQRSNAEKLDRIFSAARAARRGLD